MVEFDSPDSVETALSAAGELLEAVKRPVAVVIVGGAALNLLGIVSRITRDVDVIAQAFTDAAGETRLAHAEPFPPALQEAIATVSRDLGLPRDWMNTAVVKQWSQGLPPWTAQDLTWRSYGALEVALVGRRTLIALKLFAAVDQGPDSVHVQDLLALAPTPTELEGAVEWVKSQDTSPEFVAMVDQVADHVQAR